MQQIVATHSRKMAMALSILVGSVFFVLVVVLAMRDQNKVMARDGNATGTQILEIRRDLLDMLAVLNKTVAPDCTEANLRAMRMMMVHTVYVAELAILDAGGAVQCSTTVGMLERPAPMARPDFVGVGDAPLPVATHLDQPLPGSGLRQRTVLLTQGRFLAAPPGALLQKLLIGNIDAIRLQRPGSGLGTAVVRTDLPAPWSTTLLTPDYTDRSIDGYQVAAAAFVHVLLVPGSYYIVQSVVPLGAFVDGYVVVLAAAAAIAILIALLMYFAVTPVFLGWRGLEYRIGALLVPENMVCVYQPIIDLKTGRVAGCEVLMRLRDRHTILSPDQVIPAVVQRGLTWTLDVLVVRSAVAELVRVLPDLKDFKVAFNFFPSSVSSGMVGSMIASVLEKTPHKGLIFNVEVLEQEYQDAIIAAVADLRAHQFLVSVDDFGTGFSNLGSVKALSPDFLKIDRSFVHDMENATVRSSLIPEIIAIGRAVGAMMVAEGIETMRQYAMLKGLGVEFGQGFWLSKPLPIAAFAEYLAEHP